MRCNGAIFRLLTFLLALWTTSLPLFAQMHRSRAIVCDLAGPSRFPLLTHEELASTSLLYSATFLLLELNGAPSQVVTLYSRSRIRSDEIELESIHQYTFQIEWEMASEFADYPQQCRYIKLSDPRLLKTDQFSALPVSDQVTFPSALLFEGKMERRVSNGSHILYPLTLDSPANPEISHLEIRFSVIASLWPNRAILEPGSIVTIDVTAESQSEFTKGKVAELQRLKIGDHVYLAIDGASFSGTYPLPQRCLFFINKAAQPDGVNP